ncbi:MAG: hypothetical protein NTZ20_05590 [Candidatus Levybacteria bacterium]|nr:hypothetical protein [Candidatus Levybacteria bacterium]
MNLEHIQNDILSHVINGKSILSASKKYDISRQKIYKILKSNNVKCNYFKYDYLREELKKENYKTKSPIELSKIFNVDITIIKYYKKKFEEYSYSQEEIKNKIVEYDITKRETIRLIKLYDPNLYKSIINLTNDHILFGNKFTERIYRIENDFAPNQIIKCKYCDNRLKFYTYEEGYGCLHNICKECLPKHNGFGVSKISQIFFDKIFQKLNLYYTDRCFYHNLNSEFIIHIDHNDRINFNNNLNRFRYSVDFLFNNKIIEFDGKYWHSNIDKENEREKFILSKKYEIFHVNEIDFRRNPEKAIEKCLIFLIA